MRANRRETDELTSDQQRIDGRRPGGGDEYADRLEKLPRLLWRTSPDATWEEVAAEADRRGMLAGDAR